MAKRKDNFDSKINEMFVGGDDTFSTRFVPDDELDFHGMGVLTPYEIKIILDEFIEDSYSTGHNRVLVIVGKGKVVRPEVSKNLKQHIHVQRFKTAGYHTGGSGAYEVFLS